MVRALLFISIFFLLATAAVAQDECEITLTKAQEEFDAGRFHGVPNLLKDCLEKNQDRGWEQRANLLLAQTYLLLEDPEKADESYLNVLKANPEYLTDETRDPIDLVYLSKKFTATPIYSLTARVGLNTSFIRVIHDVDMPSELIDPVEDYSLRIGWQAALGMEYHYSPTLSLTADAMLSFTSFNHETKDVLGSSSHSFTDKQTWITLPLMIKYTHGEKALRPFASVGYSPSFLISDKANIVIDGNESEVFDWKDKRNTFNSALVLGAGLKYKWGLRYIFGEVRYSVGLFNVVNGANRYNLEGITEWPYVDDDFRMDNLYVSVGYVHPFYKARKLKKARTKSVLRKTRKTDGAGN